MNATCEECGAARYLSLSDGILIGAECLCCGYYITRYGVGKYMPYLFYTEEAAWNWLIAKLRAGGQLESESVA